MLKSVAIMYHICKLRLFIYRLLAEALVKEQTIYRFTHSAISFVRRNGAIVERIMLMIVLV